MCGFVGFLDLTDGIAERNNQAVLASMLRQVSARGPDASRQFQNSVIHLAHARLSIIDLSESSSQPMRLENDETVIVYNGEVYNYLALKKELQEASEKFFSVGDCEVFVRGFRKHGVAFLKQINGMFAAAIWDNSNQQLTLVRDRFGIKPLYWTVVGGTVVFASQISALLQYPGCRRQLSLSWLNEYLSFQYAHGQVTAFEGIYLLRPGSALVFQMGSTNPTELRWAPERKYAPNFAMSFEQASESVTEIFRLSVQNVLVSDVPVGSYLSGGIDSGALVTIVKSLQDELHTFTCGIDLQGLSPESRELDETEFARKIASSLGTIFHQKKIGPDRIMDIHTRILSTIEEPRLGVIYQNDAAAQLASTVVKVCLSGAGGDELFAGYPWRYRCIRETKTREEFLQAYYKYWQRVFNHDEKSALLRTEIKAQIDQEMPYAVFSNYFSETANYADIGSKTWLCLKYESECFLHELLQIGDRLAGAYGLEERFPFLDNGLVSFVDTVPAEYHWDFDENPTDGKFRSGKRLLRHALASLLSEEVAVRPKQGFSLPIQEWIQGELSEFVHRELYNTDARILNYLKPEAVEYALQSNRNGRSISAAQAWSLLSLECMLKSFFD